MSVIAQVLVLLQRWSIHRELDALIEAHRLLGLLLQRVLDQGGVTGLRAAIAGEIEPQDPIADAVEDEAFRVAVARVDAAEAREDAAEKKR